MPKFQHHNITTAQERVNEAQRKYLEAYGWEHTCRTPGSYWLWVRDFSDVDKDYGRITALTDMAVSMTLCTLDETEEDDE